MKPEVRLLAGILGLSKKAGKFKSGSDAAMNLVRSTPCTVFVASDASERTKKQFSDKCDFYKRRYVLLPITSAEFAAAIGRDGLLAVGAVSDASLENAIISKLEQI